MFLLHVGLFVGIGFATGQMPPEMPGHWLGRLDGALFFSIYILLGATLVGLAERVGTWGKYPAALLASVGMSCGIVGSLVCLLNVNEAVMRSIPLGSSILLLFASALLVGSIGLKTRQISWGVSGLLMAFALATVPLAMAFPVLEHWLPMYVLFDFHFVPVGIGWIVIARLLRKSSGG